MAIRRNINYINKDFSEYRAQLINYSKAYFPSTYTDFTETSPGMMFMEQAAYVGDVLSFYLDNQIQETFIQQSRQTENLFNLAYLLGYHPKVTSAATVQMNLFQQLPAKLDFTGTIVPDYDYCLRFPPNTTLTATSTSTTKFIMEDRVDFSYSSSSDPTELSVYQVAGGIPSFYLLKKTRKTISATINSTTFSFGCSTCSNGCST